MLAGSLARPGLTIALVAAFAVALGVAASRITVDNTAENWLPSGEGLEDLAEFRERFGNDGLILAMSREAAPEDERWRASFAGLADTLRGIEGVASVLAPAAAVAPRTGDAFEDALAAGQGALGSPLERHLVGADGRHAALAISTRGDLSGATRSQLVTRLEEALAAAAPEVGPLELAGADVITHDLDLGTARSLGSLAPLVLALMCAVFWRATRSARAVGAMLLAAVMAAIASIGLLALAGRPLNLVVAVMPAVLAVTTAAYATHLLAAYLATPVPPGATHDRAQRVVWWREAMEKTFRPSLLSALTTAAGFAALTSSAIAPIRDMGLFTSVGVLISFVLAMGFVPALLSLSARVTPHPVAVRRFTPERAAAATRWLRRHAPAVLAVAGLLAAAGLLGIERLAVESHILRFFPEDHRIPRNYQEIEDTLLGLTPFELVVEGPRERMLAPESVAALDAYLADALRNEPLLLQVLSPLTSIAPGASPERRASALAALLPATPAQLPDAVRKFVFLSEDGRWIALRTTLTSRTGTSNECHALVERLQAALQGRVPEGLKAQITGGPTLLIRGQVLLLETQLRSFAISFLVVTAIIALAFRSAKAVALSLVPNLLPIVFTLGLMGWLAIPLDTATVTVAGIALGLIVDDTIHLLHHYIASRGAGAERTDAVARTLFSVGRPVLVTSVAVAAGFGAFALSPFPPTRYFGMLIAWTALTAVICDLVLLPALLMLRDRRAAGAVRPEAAEVSP